MNRELREKEEQEQTFKDLYLSNQVTSFVSVKKILKKVSEEIKIKVGEKRP